MEERRAFRFNGYLSVLLLTVMAVLTVFLFINVMIGAGIFLVILIVLAASGIIMVQPNQGMVLTFFGRYVGSVRESGLWLTVPLCWRKSVSLRVRNFNSAKLKVNDVEGNPVEIAAVVVFRVVDSARALFDVDDYEKFVEIQSETALRHVATQYPYDTFEDAGYSLRGNAEEVAGELAKEVQNRLAIAGVEVIETRLTHLAYATEIASAMLQRQQATAIVSARQKIVEGAIGMVQMALDKLKEESIVDLDEERKAVMVNNLMVAIVSDRAAQPVINAGSLY